MENIFKNKNILVTGGTGSIGSVVVNELIKKKCKVIRILSNDENGLYNFSLNLSNSNKLNFFQSMKSNKIRFIYGDVTDQKRMISICENIDYIIHAAALKHVPICEYNPYEATKVNVVGTENLIQAALKNNVSKFILISTDKVVDPTTCLGATKLLAERITLNSNLVKGNKKTIFSVVRFGNIIGSRGSVLPQFISQIKNNKNLTVTHKMTSRYFVTIKEAVNCIITTLDKMKGGEIFIPKNVRSIRIYELANTIIEFFKKSKIHIKITGLRPSEKLHEKIISDHEKENIKELNNVYILDSQKKHQIKNNNKKKDYFSSENLKFLSRKDLLKYLQNNKLLD
jgi:FlaA1/EpsC-like NDP-sugar epimerase|tara:strand:+ start:632 stop:1654 length:1023 start_codon:yes stop_codon:yes gene_type:complete